MQTPKTAASENPAHTYSHFGPKIEPQSWAENGAKSAWAVATERVRGILATHHPEYLSSDQDAMIRSQFKIL